MQQDITSLAQRTKLFSTKISCAKPSEKSIILRAIHQALIEEKDEILMQNQLDMKAAELAVASGNMSKTLLKRLDLSLPGKWDSMAQGVLDIDQLPDPVGKIELARQLDEGLKLFKVTCPVGAIPLVLLIIFEARPEVVVQISCLSIKSGNAVLLKGGKEAQKSNQALFKAIQKGINAAKIDIPSDIVQLVESREDIKTLLGLDRYVDLVIPRGSNQLVRYVQENTRIPVLGHADGICSIYIDEEADIDIAKRVVVDGKINYPAACNSTEKMLIHKSVIQSHLGPLVESLLHNGVIIKADSSCFEFLQSKSFLDRYGEKISLATDQDFQTEFLDLIIGIKSVESLEEAINHINLLGSRHTDCIVTENDLHGETFMQQVDSAGVYRNASTRFADGFRYGFGAEIGVSTNKTHARGPVGLDGLLIYKYRVYGNGHIVAEYNEGRKNFNRKEIEAILPFTL